MQQTASPNNIETKKYTENIKYKRTDRVAAVG